MASTCASQAHARDWRAALPFRLRHESQVLHWTLSVERWALNVSFLLSWGQASSRISDIYRDDPSPLRGASGRCIFVSQPWPTAKQLMTARFARELRWSRRALLRSKERRVGKECRSRWSPY